MSHPEKMRLPYCTMEEHKKKVYIALNQISFLEATLLSYTGPMDGEQLIDYFNNILKIAREVFACDETFKQAAAPLQELKLPAGSPLVEDALRHQIIKGRVLNAMASLKGIVLAFIAIHLSPEERNALGFQREQTVIRD